MILASAAIQLMSLLEPEREDEIMRNLAPPLGVLLAAVILQLWARRAHRRARADRETHPAE